MRKTMIGLVLFSVLSHPIVGHVEAQPSKPVTIKITLQEAVLLGLSNNIDIKIERLQPKIAETDIQAAESEFDPIVEVGADQSVSRIQSPVSPFLTGSFDPFENDVNVAAALQKKLSTGAVALLEAQNNRVSSNSQVQRFQPSWGTDLTLSVIQPLLKDFGPDFNLGQIVIAKNNKAISDLQFKKRAIDIITVVKEAYWDLVQAFGQLDVAKQSMKLAQDLLEINKAKVEVGQLAPIDVVEAEAALATREEAVILAEDAIQDVQDRLKALLFLDGTAPLGAPAILPIDRPVDTEFRFVVPREVQTALKSRPEYLQTKTELENRKVSLSLAENQVRPRVDLVASAGVNGLGGSYPDAVDEMDGDYYDLRIGLRFVYPLGNRAARSQLIRSKIERRQVDLRLTDLEKNITLEVREAVRQVETDFKRIRTTRVARRLAEKKLEAQQAKFEVGIATTKDVLDFQVDLAIAQNRELVSLIDYNQSMVRLYQILGTTLEQNGITANMLQGS
jgi:outer membrane protein TolC